MDSTSPSGIRHENVEVTHGMCEPGPIDCPSDSHVTCVCEMFVVGVSMDINP